MKKKPAHMLRDHRTFGQRKFFPIMFIVSNNTNVISCFDTQDETLSFI